MTIIGVVSETLLYLCFSIILGSFILHIVPKPYRPEINVPKKFLLLSIIGIAILSITPALQVILTFYKDIGLGLTIRSVLFTFEVGQAWIVTFILSNILFIYLILFDIRKKSTYSYVGIAFTLALILTLGWSSHASSLTEVSGFIAHTIHFLAVSIWIGILLVISWFSSNKENWLTFLKWFSPVAITCFLVTVGTGLFLMSLVVDFKDYTNAWMLSYGQALLIKHLLIIPLLAFAFINSVLMRNQLNKDKEFNPKPWVKAESIILLLIFAATAVLGQQSPPHDIETALATNGPAKLFELLYQGQIERDLSAFLSFGINSISLLGLAILFLALTIFSFVKKAPMVLSFVMSILVVLTSYLALMLSVFLK